jgi:hypothetical protein
MLGALRHAIDVGLRGQMSRLAGLVEDYKEHTLDRLKRQAAATAVTAAVAVIGLAFMLMAVVIGLAALYYGVALWHGTMAGLGAAGGAAVALALLMFAIVAVRAAGGRRREPNVALAQIKAEARAAIGRTRASVADPGRTAERAAAALGKESVDAAVGVMRSGSREAVLATLLATVLIGVWVGRHR